MKELQIISIKKAHCAIELNTSNLSSRHLRTVSGGTELVWNLDTAAVGESLDSAWVETGDTFGGILDASADGLAVLGGLSRRVDGLQSSAAIGRDASSAYQVRYTRGERSHH